jgi:hypothetical protein
VDRFPALYSHCIRKKLSVAQVSEAGVDASDFLVERLSVQAVGELEEARELLENCQFSDMEDGRQGAFCLPHGKYDSGGLYRLLKSRDGTPVPAAKFVWDS